MLMRHEAARDIVLVNSKNSNLADSRNQIVNIALQHGSKWLLFFDSDMTFPVDTLSRLLSHDRQIVGASYCRRVPPYDLIGEPLGAPGTDPLIRMARMPPGCLLICADVFLSLRQPYFVFGTAADGSAISEDFMFCDSVRHAGWEVWCDQPLTRAVGHVGQIVVTTQTSAALGQFAKKAKGPGFGTPAK